jgi:hypothetical protein
MADNESVNMEGVWLVYYACPNEGVEGNSILTIKGLIPKKDVIKNLKSSIFCTLSDETMERCGNISNMIIKGLTRIGDVK